MAGFSPFPFIETDYNGDSETYDEQNDEHDEHFPTTLCQQVLCYLRRDERCSQIKNPKQTATINKTTIILIQASLPISNAPPLYDEKISTSETVFPLVTLDDHSPERGFPKVQPKAECAGILQR